jgi:pilus assembly protein CpaB
MSRVSGCLWLGVALILALVAGGAAFVTLQKATVAPAAGNASIPMTSVVVASHPMPIGTLLTEKDITLQNLPTGALPAGVQTTVAAVSGQLTTVALDAGEMVLAHHLTHPDITGGNLAFTLPEGLVAVSLSADDLVSGLGIIQPADHIDILYSLQTQGKDVPAGTTVSASDKGQRWTFGTLQNVTVISVIGSALKDAATASNSGSTSSTSTTTAVGAARAYILALPPQDALTLKFIKDAGGVMDLALRNVADEGDHNSQPVNEQYVVDRFRLTGK